MPSPPTPPPRPVGEDSWLDYIDQQSRGAHGLEKSIPIIELYRGATDAEAGSIKVWVGFCEYFWSLHRTCHGDSPSDWPAADLADAREFFSLDAALHLWSEGHDATKYRLDDSHRLWNRWMALERELLDRTQTADGVKRITHLYCDRLLIPHATWDETSQMFSSFLSKYNPAEYEDIMRSVTELAAPAKKLYGAREHLEAQLGAAPSRAAMRDYLLWEIANVGKERKQQATAIQLALGLFSRALTGPLATDEGIWTDFIVFVSNLRSIFSTGKSKNDELLRLLPNSLDVLYRAVEHCPWSGGLWARYVLSGEEAGLDFYDMERIKHAATSSSQLDRDGMTAVVDMYAAWCGYLKRTAMDTNAPDEAVDIADSGLVTALEAVQVWGERRFGDKYEGDPSFRLERILIQYLTEKHEAIDEAREQWTKLAERRLYSSSYDFWLTYFMWEMLVFQAQKGKNRSPTPGASGLRVPTLATEVLERAIRNKTLDWPERVMEVYVNHCNDYQTSDTLRRALNTVHKVRQSVLKRRQQEAAAAAAAYADAHTPEQQQQEPGREPEQEQNQTHATEEDTESSVAAATAKRKRETSPEDGAENEGSKRPRNGAATQDGDDEKAQQQQKAKRDRENTSIFVTGLPADVTATKVKSYFKAFGHINNLAVQKEGDKKSSVAFIEFRTPEDVQSALIRDGKYFGEHLMAIKPATNHTIFVTNFPPSADDAYIRDLFKDCGDIFAVRWPSLKFNTHRRFCYVTFRDLGAAAKAVALDGKTLQGRYKLSSMYSDPTVKKSREGATEDGREVHVKNLDQDVDDETLRVVFVKFGEVERIRILRTVAGKSRGSAFVVLSNKEDAQRAVSELDGTKLRSQIMQVELSVPSNYKPLARTTGGASQSPAPAGEEEEAAHGDNAGVKSADYKDRTFALIGIPDTVNISRVRSVVEPHGTIVKLILRADHGGAIVELSDVATAGRAQLALDGVEMDGRRLRTGTVAELLKEKAEKRIDRVDQRPAKPKPGLADRLMPPPRVKRPVPKTGGKKPGLGYVPSAVANGDTTKTGGMPTEGGAKSNTDFRKLFLGSGKDDNSKGDAQGEKKGNGAAGDIDAPANGGQ